MNQFSTFIAMGGYGAYVWPAYGLTVIAFVGMLGWTIATLRARRRKEQALAVLGRPRRNRQETQP